MITIPKQYKKEIKAFQKEISDRQKEDDKKFDNLCKKMGVDAVYSDSLWDHIYNGTEWTVEYSKK